MVTKELQRNVFNRQWRKICCFWINDLQTKKIYVDVLNDIVDKYNYTYQRTFKAKAIDVKPDSYAEYNIPPNEKYPKFKVGDYVRVSKYKNIFPKGCAPLVRRSFCY